MKHLKATLNEAVKRLSYHPIHIILGLVTCAIGVCLICNDDYYFWPPCMASFLNSGWIGVWALFTGLGLIYVSVRKDMSDKTNNILLLSQCGLTGGETFLEFSHGIIANNSHMIAFSFAMLGYLLITFWMIRTDGSFAHKTTKRIEKRDRQLERR